MLREQGREPPPAWLLNWRMLLTYLQEFIYATQQAVLYHSAATGSDTGMSVDTATSRARRFLRLRGGGQQEMENPNRDYTPEEIDEILMSQADDVNLWEERMGRDDWDVGHSKRDGGSDAARVRGAGLLLEPGGQCKYPLPLPLLYVLKVQLTILSELKIGDAFH